MTVATSLRRFAGGLHLHPLLRRSLTTQTSPKIAKQNVPYLMMINRQKPGNPIYLYNPSTQSISLLTLPAADAGLFSRHHLVSISRGFVFSVDHVTADFHAVDPLTGARLPIPSSATSIPGISGVIRDPLVNNDDVASDITGFVYSRPPTDWSKYTSILQLTKDPKLPSPPPDQEVHVIGHFDIVHRFFKKAVLSPSLDLAAVIVHYGRTPCVRCTSPGLLFARLPGPIPTAPASSSWSPLSYRIDPMVGEDGNKDDDDDDFKDILFHNGKLHAINKAGTLAIFDLNGGGDPNRPFVSPKGPLGDQKKSWARMLVESPDGDELFLVLRVMEDKNSTKGFIVFKLDEQSYEWQQVNGIGDLAMFVDSNNSVAVSAGDFPNLKPNSIYYFRIIICGAKAEREDPGIFSLEDGTKEGFRHGHDDLRHFNAFQWLVPAA